MKKFLLILFLASISFLSFKIYPAQAATDTKSGTATAGKSITDRVRESLFGSSGSSSQSQEAATQNNGPVYYANGVYTNLCGTGTAATAHTCNGGCNTATGSCISGTSNVVKFTCEGKQTECRSNESAFASSHQVAGTSCGKTVQIDVFNKNCRAGGGWNCNDDDIVDYIVWYSGDCTGTGGGGDSCSNHQPINTQFRKSGQTNWVTGNELTNTDLVSGDQIDVNCFAKNGAALLPGAEIEVTLPNGQQQTVSNNAELRNYTLNNGSGYYAFRCVSATLNNCRDTDSVRVRGDVQPTPTPTPTTDHVSSCDDIDAISGNGDRVPATVRLRARGSDNEGNIQRYRFYFGDGEQTESSNPEVEHVYETSGRFTARVDIRDSQGNWKSSNRCETRITVDPSAIESHKSACSNLFVSADNGAMAPSLVSFDINGYDNKGDIQAYRIETGTGETIEDDDDKIEFKYEKAGTYTVRAYIKDSEGNWQGGSNGCKRTVYINTEKLTSQPATGTPTVIPLIGIGSGALGLALQYAKKKLWFQV